jgi:metal-responsive CopG/Arc/MetJ family transcriptional regulator
VGIFIRKKMARKKEDSHQFSVKFPKSLLEEIDQICAANYITKTTWLIRSAIEKLERERTKGAEDLIAKIASHEK